MPTDLERELIAEAWTSLRAGADQAPIPDLEVVGRSGELVSPFPVEETAVACVATALMAAASLAEPKEGEMVPVSLDRGHVTAAVRSERYFRSGGRPAGAGFAPLSRFWPTADGWVRTHANYPWHRAALLEALGAGEDVDAIAAALAEMGSLEVEDRVFAAGGVATAVRSLDEWQRHPQGQSLATEPLISHHRVGDAPARRPVAGMRVLDLTRVIAGPVATRFLGALGADVLRLDPPQRLDMPAGAVSDTLLAKRSAFLDLAAPGSGETIRGLLREADAVVCGYRPGALERFGLDAGSLATDHPGLIVVYLCAWGHQGPWHDRRGFDSVVQAPTGIAAGEGGGRGEPGALPCQLLDHGTGYLAAAAVLDGRRRQASEGGTHIRRLSLARTAMWLTSRTGLPRPSTSAAADDPERWIVDLPRGDTTVSAVGPPGALDGRPLRWPSGPAAYGGDDPAW